MDETPVKDKDDWWVFADGYMAQAYSYHIIKKSTYEDLQGKIYTDNNNSQENIMSGLLPLSYTLVKTLIRAP